MSLQVLLPHSRVGNLDLVDRTKEVYLQGAPLSGSLLPATLNSGSSFVDHEHPLPRHLHGPSLIQPLQSQRAAWLKEWLLPLSRQHRPTLPASGMPSGPTTCPLAEWSLPLSRRHSAMPPAFGIPSVPSI